MKKKPTLPWTHNQVWQETGSSQPVISSSRLTCALSAWVSPPDEAIKEKLFYFYKVMQQYHIITRRAPAEQDKFVFC